MKTAQKRTLGLVCLLTGIAVWMLFKPAKKPFLERVRECDHC